MDSNTSGCIPCPLTCFPVRLQPGEEIKEELSKFAIQRKLKAAFVISCVGSVTKVSLRMADSKTIKDYYGHFEIVSLVGTISGGGHLHASLSDEEGHVFGGHVVGNMIVFTTAEIIIGECSGTSFSREQDDRTGFKELVIKNV